jgi:hypothetical protein
MPAGDLLPDRRDYREEALRVIKATKDLPLDNDGKWKTGDALLVLMDMYCPADQETKEAKQDILLRLSELAKDTGFTANRLKEYWLVSWHFDPDVRVDGKTWEDHRRALYRSDTRRGKYNLKVALGLLAHDERAEEYADPFESYGLKGKQLEAARRIWRNQDDFKDPAVVGAVTREFRGKHKGGTRAVNSIHANILRKLEETEKLRQKHSSDWANIISRYHTQMLATADACYQLKVILEDLPVPARKLFKEMIEGSVFATDRALRDLMEALIE